MIVDAAICFANSRGGHAVIGVVDKAPGAAALLGTEIAVEQVRRRVYELTNPPLLVDVHERYVDGVRLVDVAVPEGADVHADSQGRASWRVGTQCLPMGPAQIQILRQDRTGFDPSASRSSRSAAEVDPTALNLCRSLLRSLVDRRRELANLSADDLLSALGLVADDGQLLVAGELLLCTPAETAVLYQYRTTPGGEPSDVERLRLPLVIAQQEVLRRIRARRTMTPVSLPNGQQLEIDDFPDLAFREALTNALVHRDHGQSGPVDVDHSPQVLTVTSPGPLVSGVTVDNILTTPSRPRNPSLMNAVQQLGLSERTGRGVDRMYREMIRSGRQPPSITATFDTVRVALVGGAPNVNIARTVAQLPEAEREDTDTMLVLMYMCDHETVSAERIAPVLQRPIQVAQSVLDRLAGDATSLLDVSRSTVRRRHPTYRLREDQRAALGTALAYRVRNTDEIDRRIVAHVREYGWITNKTIQNLFGVDVFQARRWLADLKKRGVLRQTTEGRTTGPGIQYGPGEAFPPARSRRTSGGRRKR